MKSRLALVLCALAPLVHAESVSIKNEHLQVSFDTQRGTFSIQHMPDGKTILSELLYKRDYKEQKIEKSPDGISRLSITENSDSEIEFVLRPHDPFVRIENSLKNSTTAAEDIAGDVGTIRNLSPDLGVPIPDLVFRGTGGLHPATDYDNEPTSFLQLLWRKLTPQSHRPPQGSYEWIAIADPSTRHGLVISSIAQRTTNTIITPGWIGNDLKIRGIVVSNQLGAVQLKPGDSLLVETLAIGYFDDVRLGLEQYADLIARENQIKLPPQPAGYTTWYAEQHGGSGDEKSLAELTTYIDKNLRPWGMNFVQIDDGWQTGISRDLHRGPNKNFAVSRVDRFPAGMKSAADQIRAAGLTPGLWLLPFSGDAQDPAFADKQNLFVQKDGKPYDTPWGGTCLDLSNPAARQFLTANVTNIVHNLGFNYLKIDGLYTGLGIHQVYISSDYNPNDDFGTVTFSDPNKTPVENFRSGLQLIRQAAGPNTFILGCNTAQNMRIFGPSMGLVDAMRIGPDNFRPAPDDGAAGKPDLIIDWKTWSTAGPLFGSREYFLNGRVWYNDPDPCYVRASLPLDVARTTASWTAISGQLYTNSDWLPALPPERLDILRHTLAPHGKTARPVDFLENDPPRIWEVLDDKAGRYVVALFNWSDSAATITVPLDKLDLPKSPRYAAFDFWANQFLPDVTTQISAKLPPHACQIIALRAVANHPVVLSTSAHVTQGMTDLLEEKWNPAVKQLSGKSHVIAGVPYELRLATPDPAQKWKSFGVLPANPQAGADAKYNRLTPTDTNHRAAFTVETDGDYLWTLQF